MDVVIPEWIPILKYSQEFYFLMSGQYKTGSSDVLIIRRKKHVLITDWRQAGDNIEAFKLKDFVRALSDFYELYTPHKRRLRQKILMVAKTLLIFFGRNENDWYN